MKQNNLFQKGFLIIIALKNIHNYLPPFSLEEIDKFDMLSHKNSKYLLYKFNDWIESLGVENILISHTSKVKIEVGLQKIEERDKQFLIEKFIYEVEKKNPYTIETEKKPEILLEMKKNYLICRKVYQSLFVEVANTFIQYINTLTPGEIEQLDNDLKADGWGVSSIVEIENSIELLCIFQMFNYYNGRLPFTNGLWPVPDGTSNCCLILKKYP